jgi:hypothetical protein
MAKARKRAMVIGSFLRETQKTPVAGGFAFESVVWAIPTLLS